MYVVGVDPGAEGAAVVIGPLGEIVDIFRFGKMSEMDVAAAFQTVRVLYSPARVVIEKVQSFGAQRQDSPKTMFQFGYHTGFVRGCIGAARLSLDEILPQKWQQTMGLGGKFAGKTQRKNAHKQKVEQLYPDRKWTLDQVDAVLIGLAYKRLNNL